MNECTRIDTTNKLSTQNGWNSLERDREEEEGDLERKTVKSRFFIKIVFGVCIFRKSLGIFGGGK